MVVHAGDGLRGRVDYVGSGGQIAERERGARGQRWRGVVAIRSGDRDSNATIVPALDDRRSPWRCAAGPKRLLPQ